MSSENFAKLYKNAGKPDDLRRRRTETSVELRKQKGNDEMMKRRNLDLDLADESITSGGSDSELVSDPRPQLLSVEDAVAVLQNNPTKDQIRTAFESVRRALSRDKDPPIDKVIQLGFPFALVQALNFEDEKVQFEAAWAITNIVSGNSDQTMVMVKAGAIGPLIKLCESTSPKMAEQAAWAVANLAGDSTQMRDLLISEGVLPVLIGLANRLSELNPSFVRILAWTFSNLCRHKKPQAALNVLETIAPAIAKLIKYKDTQTQNDGLWALSYLTDGNDEHIELAHKQNVMTDLVEFANSGHDSLISPALRVLGNFVTGNDNQTQVVIDTGILKGAIPQLLISNNTALVKECCWLISNVLAGNTSQIEDVIEAQLLPILVNILQNGESRLQYEVSWGIANLCYGGTANQIIEICRTKTGVEAICSCLVVKNNELVMNMLDALHTLLRTVSQTDPENLGKVRERVEESGGLDHLEALQHHESEKIYSVAYKIIEEFFTGEEDEGLDEVSVQNMSKQIDTTFDF